MAAATPVNRQWRLKSRPTGLIKADNFELVSQPMPVPEEAQLLIRSDLSLDPAMRGWLIDRPSYVPGLRELTSSTGCKRQEERRAAEKLKPKKQ